VPGPHVWTQLAAGLVPGAATGDTVVGGIDLAGDAAMKNARACIQIHGGMGYTWEMPPHYYLKRAWVLSTWFGTSEEHEERLAAALGT
jgi:alkylation response protein AidB-like acyl-CoA dehydrogenase